MINCHSASRLISKSREYPLPLLKRFSLFIHLKACDACHNFLRHVEIFSRVAKNPEDSNQDIDEAMKMRILNHLRHHQNTPPNHL
ncbi:MAG: hypothetical protein KGI54_10115 [Pseudomonadota bacterium]|nr:hypothetical protein [Pseudomonadota bacterium]